MGYTVRWTYLTRVTIVLLVRVFHNTRPPQAAAFTCNADVCLSGS